ncbi:hypothetical protein MCERE19_02158 [Spirosomataceae bacterium]
MYLTFKNHKMILLIFALILALVITIFSKLKVKRSNSVSKEYLSALRNRPKSANY